MSSYYSIHYSFYRVSIIKFPNIPIKRCTNVKLDLLNYLGTWPYNMLVTLAHGCLHGIYFGILSFTTFLPCHFILIKHVSHSLLWPLVAGCCMHILVRKGWSYIQTFVAKIRYRIDIKICYAQTQYTWILRCSSFLNNMTILPIIYQPNYYVYMNMEGC